MGMVDVGTESADALHVVLHADVFACWCVACRCDADEWKKKKKKTLTCRMGWWWWMRALRTRMRCMWTCLLADALPADADECKCKWKIRLTWMQMCCVLCCVRTCLLADVLPADTDECKWKRKKYLPGRGCVACRWVCLLMHCLQTRMSVNKNERNTYLMVNADVLRLSVLAWLTWGCARCCICVWMRMEVDGQWWLRMGQMPVKKTEQKRKRRIKNSPVELECRWLWMRMDVEVNTDGWHSWWLSMCTSEFGLGDFCASLHSHNTLLINMLLPNISVTVNTNQYYTYYTWIIVH